MKNISLIKKKILSNKIIFKIKKKKTIIGIAFSGGKDSQILLKVLNHIIKIKVIIYINHNINNKNNLTIKNLFYLCKKKNKSLIIKNIFVKKSDQENKARIKRYKKIIQICKKKNIKAIIFSHQKNDLLENKLIYFMKQKNRKIKKITKIKKIKVFRPFLTINTTKILKIIKLKHFCIDNENYNIKIIRNYTRLIIKLINKK